MKKDLIKLNASSVRKSFLRFLAFFAVVIFLSFLSIFFFLKSYAIQRDNIQKDIVAYKEVLNKQEVLKSKMDTIYYQMSLLSTDKVRNDVFLSSYISKNIQETREIIGNDSISEFKGYSFLLNRLDSIMALKTEIIDISDKERLALKDLNECMGKISKVKSEISKDPTRGFQSK
jgi:hypothetical protein